MYVDALSEGSRTRVRFPPPPPDYAFPFLMKGKATSRHATGYALEFLKGEVCRAEAEKPLLAVPLQKNASKIH
jgi:hypothetical protein